MYKKQAFIFDVDGTISQVGGRLTRHSGNDGYRAYKDAHDDVPDFPTLKILESLGAAGYFIIILTGRKLEGKEVLVEWLRINGIIYDELLMREDDDHSKDYDLKRDIYVNDIEPHFNVIGVFEDRSRNVEMWRELGLKCYQVQPGDF